MKDIEIRHSNRQVYAASHFIPMTFLVWPETDHNGYTDLSRQFFVGQSVIRNTIKLGRGSIVYI